MELYAKAVTLNPTRADAWQQYGEALYRGKKYKDAIPRLEKAATLGAGMRGDMEFEIAECYAKQGDSPAAILHLRRSLDQGFRDLPYARTDPDFTPLFNDPEFKNAVGLPSSQSMSRTQGWRFDIRLLSRELIRVHYRPFEHVSREIFERAVQFLIRGVDSMNDAELGVGCMKLAQMMGDGHTEMWSLYAGDNAELIPLQVSLFEEGLFITAASPPQKDLVGARVIAVNGVPITVALEKLMKLTSHENSMFPKFVAPRMMRSPAILSGLHIGSNVKSVRLKLEKPDGSSGTHDLTAEKGDSNTGWVSSEHATMPLYLLHPESHYWIGPVEKGDLVYAQISGFINDASENFAMFCARLRKTVDSSGARFLVLDLRRNGGGNNQLVPALLEAIIRSGGVNQRGHLFVIIGRNTFSAAVSACATIERFCHPIFVGEPTGSSPNFVGEVAPLQLPYSKLQGSVSDLYWQNARAFDYRTWIGPELYTPPTWNDFKEGRDAAMEAIEKFIADQTKSGEVTPVWFDGDVRVQSNRLR